MMSCILDFVQNYDESVHVAVRIIRIELHVLITGSYCLKLVNRFRRNQSTPDHNVCVYIAIFCKVMPIAILNLVSICKLLSTIAGIVSWCRSVAYTA